MWIVLDELLESIQEKSELKKWRGCITPDTSATQLLRQMSEDSEEARSESQADAEAPQTRKSRKQVGTDTVAAQHTHMY